MMLSGRGEGVLSILDILQCMLRGGGVISLCQCCHKDSQILCKVMIVSKDKPSRGCL